MAELGITRQSVFVIFLHISSLLGIQGSERVDPLVQTEVGLIRGVIKDDYSMFLSIPYAQVDYENPFGPSLPYPKFDTIFEANKDLPMCPQEFGGTLDCLKLNIHVPNSANSKNLLPVLVWIHGGAFVSGSGHRDEFGPNFFMKHDIILVTINYRVSVYGFMCVDYPRVAGNQGLKDQQVALKWIKDNIKAFGGDENKITVAGESAGAASVDFHLLYDKERIFSQAILHSGTSLSPWALTKPIYGVHLKLATHMGFDISNQTEDSENALKFIFRQNSKDIIKAVIDLGLEFSPCVERKFEGVKQFLTEDIMKSQTDLKGVSVMIGSTAEECQFMYASEDIGKVGKLFENELKNFYGIKGKSLKIIEEIIRHFYIGDKELSNDIRSGVIEYESDSYFVYPIERSTKKLKELGVNIYRFLFSYNGERNFLKKLFNITSEKSIHADDLGYLFDMEMFKGQPTKEDKLMIDRMTTMWANFVKYGVPTRGDSTELIPVDWPPIAESTIPYLDLDLELSIKSRPFEKRMAFWDLLFSYLSFAKENSHV